jgi:hypothetical protein
MIENFKLRDSNGLSTVTGEDQMTVNESVRDECNDCGWCCSWLRQCTTRWEFSGSVFGRVCGIFK